MSLIIGLLYDDAVYMAADSRITREYPVVGVKYYDYFQKLGYLEVKGDIWLSSAGIIGAAYEVVNKLEQQSVKTIDSLQLFGPEFFKNCHIEVLKRYKKDYRAANDSSNFLNLLFGGIDGSGKAKLCWIDSANDYKLQWFDSKGDFIFNRIDNGEIDKNINFKLQVLAKNIEAEKNVNKHIIESLKLIFKYVSDNDIGVSPLMYFVKISVLDKQYKEFYHIRRIINRLKAAADNFLYSKNRI